jgi:hypothetical protein
VRRTAGFIRRYVVHAEWHPGYRPRLSIRRAPRAGDRVMNGDEPSTLVPCRDCGTVGFFADPIEPRATSPAADEPPPIR